MARWMGVAPWDLLDKPYFWYGAAKGTMDILNEEDQTGFSKRNKGGFSKRGRR